MELSHNVLVIESLSTVPEHGKNMVLVRGKMNATVKFLCSVTGLHFRSLIIESEGEGYSDTTALKNAIQNFLFGYFYSETQYYSGEISSVASNKIHQVVIQVPEPFKSLFEELFDVTNWEMPKLELPKS